MCNQIIWQTQIVLPIHLGDDGLTVQWVDSSNNQNSGLKTGDEATPTMVIAKNGQGSVNFGIGTFLCMLCWFYVSTLLCKYPS